MSSLEQDQSGLRVDLDTARSNVADMREDLTSTSGDLGALKHTFLLSQDQRDAQHESQRRADHLLLIHDLSSIAFTVSDRAAFDIAAVAVEDAIQSFQDGSLATAWGRVSPAYHDFLDASLGSQDEFDAFETWRIAVDTFLGILQQRLTADVGQGG